LREWRNGLPSNHAILFARKDSGIASLADLNGRRVAFEDAGSATSYILPRVALERAGHRLVELPAMAPPRSDAVGYAFAQEEINVATWVHKGRADAGALGNQDWDDPERVPPAMREDLRIFHRTEPVPRSLLLLRGDLPAPLKHRIKEILLAAPDDAEGRRVLDLYRKVTRYDVLEGQAASEVAAAWRIAQALR
jgi:phosphonate transport system substrate-binding protein